MDEIIKKYSDLASMPISAKIKETAYKLARICNAMEIVLSRLSVDTIENDSNIQKMKQYCDIANNILSKYIDYVLANGQEPKDFASDESIFCKNYLSFLDISVSVDIGQRYQNNIYFYNDESKIRATAKLHYNDNSEITLDNILNVGVIVTYIPNGANNSGKGVNIKMHPSDISPDYCRTFSAPTKQNNEERIDAFKKKRKLSSEKMLLDLMNQKVINEKWKKGEAIDFSTILGYVDTM